MVNETCTTITFRNENGEYSVKQHVHEMDIYHPTIENLIIPVLLASGYSREVITKELGE